MSTSGSFTPAAVPECAYAPLMTRAQALALRAAGQLNPNCVVVISDGPVIGTAGNTSPTQIELQPVTPTDLGRAANVHTNFDNVAFLGNYNIDDGPDGSLNALTDHWDNTIRDEDAGAPTVHTQFPFHLSGPNMRDNVITDCDLIGWGGLVNYDVRANVMSDSSVDLTGETTTARFVDNQVQRSTVTSHALQSTIELNTFTDTTVTVLGAIPGLGFTQNTFIGGDFIADAATTSSITASDNIVAGTTGGYRIRVTGHTGTQVNIQGNRMFNRGAAAQELLVGGSRPTVTVTSNEITAGDIRLISAGASSSTITGCTFGAAVVTQDAATTNVLNLNRCEVSGASIIQTANALGTATLSVSAGTRLINGFVIAQDGTGGVTVTAATLHGHAASATGDLHQNGGQPVSVIESDIQAWTSAATILNQAATGAISVTGSRVLSSLGTPFTRLAGATASLTVSGSDLNGARFVQSATCTGTLIVQNVRVWSSLVTHNGAGALSLSSGMDVPRGLGVTTSAASTRGLTISGGVFSDATINQNRTGGTATDQLASVYMSGVSTLTLNGAVDPGGLQTLLNRVTIGGTSAVTITDPAVSTVLQNSEVFDSALTLPAGCQLSSAMRFFRCVVDVGTFTHDSTIVDGPFATVFTGPNNQRLANKSFSDVV